MAVKRKLPQFKNVMLVDDSEIDNFINQKMIEGCNFAENIYIHTSTKSSLEFLKNFERISLFSKELLPSVILLDINMPILDGFQFLDEYEKLSEEIKNHCKIVMLTTSVNPMDQERSLQNKHVIKYLNKPLTREHLAAIQ